MKRFLLYVVIAEVTNIAGQAPGYDRPWRRSVAELLLAVTLSAGHVKKISDRR